jgi:hypothetical protein
MTLPSTESSRYQLVLTTPPRERDLSRDRVYRMMIAADLGSLRLLVLERDIQDRAETSRSSNACSGYQRGHAKGEAASFEDVSVDDDGCNPSKCRDRRAV